MYKQTEVRKIKSNKKQPKKQKSVMWQRHRATAKSSSRMIVVAAAEHYNRQDVARLEFAARKQNKDAVSTPSRLISAPSVRPPLVPCR